MLALALIHNWKECAWTKRSTILNLLLLQYNHDICSRQISAEFDQLKLATRWPSQGNRTGEQGKPSDRTAAHGILQNEETGAHILIDQSTGHLGYSTATASTHAEHFWTKILRLTCAEVVLTGSADQVPLPTFTCRFDLIAEQRSKEKQSLERIIQVWDQSFLFGTTDEVDNARDRVNASLEKESVMCFFLFSNPVLIVEPASKGAKI